MNRSEKRDRWITSKTTPTKPGGTRQAKENGHFVNINHIYAATVLVVLAFLICELLFIRFAVRLNRDETIGYIQTATERTTFAVNEYIKEEFDSLMSAAIVAQERQLLSDDTVLRSLVYALKTHNPYVQVGFADKNGQGVWADLYGREHRGDLSAEGFITRALSGKNALSRVRHDEISGEDVHYYAVPVYDEKTGVVDGVLFAAIRQSQLRSIVNNSLYAGKGLAHIINSQGEYIVRSDSPLVIGIGESIFALQTPLSKELETEIRENLAANKTGYLIKNFYGENRLVAYAPLEINDWHIFYAVPESMVSAGVKNIMFGTIIIASLAAGVLILFILTIRKVNNKNRAALEKMAFVDPVTGHRNFHKFLLDAEEILKNANGTQYAINCFDIKDFGYINDVFGRDVGDRMLEYLADFQERISQEGEITARISEDTFVSLRKYKSKREVQLRFDGAAQQLAIFPQTFASGYKAEMYGGAYLIDPADGALSLNDMIDRATAAQDKAKATGGTTRFVLYSNEMREQKLWEAQVESTKEAALENGEFEVYLQPKIDIQHGDRILGAEALVRWNSPENGLILPGRFIDIFEKNGFIVDLDRFVFDEACRHYKDVFAVDQSFVLSVNVSRLGLLRPDFIRTYTEVRESYGIPAGAIELEFTESLVFGDYKLFKATIAECKRNGFLCSMDDFGAGYSSLNMLKSIHVDILKLDRQFFLSGDDQKRGQKLIKSIVAMAKALNMKTIAEGIDDKALVEKLRAVGCDAVQGYVFAKPMPIEDFKVFLAAWQAEHPGKI